MDPKTNGECVVFPNTNMLDENRDLTKRERFAAMAMQGLLANPGGPIQANGRRGWALCNCTADQVGEFAKDLGDALLHALAAESEG